MNKLLAKIKTLDWVTLLEVFILVMLVVMPSVISFLGSKADALKYIVPILFLYIPFVALFVFFEKNRFLFVSSYLLFFAIFIYFLSMYFSHRYYDIYSDKEFGIFKIITGYSSFFIVLFFSIKYKSKSIVCALQISGFLVLAISIISMVVYPSTSADYDMNFGYKVLFSTLCFVSMTYFTKNKYLFVLYVLSAIAAVVLLLVFGSRGPLISLLLFLFAYYNLFFKTKLSKKIRTAILVGTIALLVIYVIACFVISNSPLFNTLPRNAQAIFNPFSTLTTGTGITRKRIYSQIFTILKDTPFFGYGPLADQYFLGAAFYSHNFFLEILITFGFFVGIILLALVFLLVLKVLFLSDEYKTEVLFFTIFLCLSFGRLTVSYSFWYDNNFWMMIGLGVMILAYDKELKSQKAYEDLVKEQEKYNKCYYIHFGARKMTGVAKKIDDQITELKRHFETEEIDVAPKKDSFISKVIATMPFFSISRDYKAALSLMKEASYFYIRNTIIDLRLLLFIRAIRKKFPTSKIVVELYTYPYDKCEFARKYNWAFFYKDFIYRHFYKFYIDRFVTYGDYDRIFGVPTIKTINGIDFSTVAPHKREKGKKTIDLISVAQYQNHHAYDRLISGIADYYKNGGKENVVFHVVGFGMSLESYKQLSEKLLLSNHVIFYGKKEGKELDEIYDKCDIAVATLGFHRIGVKVSSALKTREYLSKGMPIVYSGKIDIVEDDFKYQYCAPEDESNIDVNKIVQLYHSFIENEKRASREIISYVKKKASIEASLYPVVEFLRTNENAESN